MRTLCCSVVLTFTLLAAPAATAWEAPVSKASLVSWQELLAAVAGWFGDEEMEPFFETERTERVVESERPDTWLGAGPLEGPPSCGQVTCSTGDLGPGMDPEG